MNYFFESQERQDKLGSVLEEWIGTPFRHKCGVKGLGCDCIHFVGKVLEEFELIDFKRIKMPDYPRDWHLHNKKERLAASIVQYLNVERIFLKNNDILVNGDIILFHYGKAASHAGIFYKNRIYHALQSVGKVTKTSFSDRRYRRMMRFFYRVKDNN
jgi:cell wall-associated NlpC family hydrolase